MTAPGVGVACCAPASSGPASRESGRNWPDRPRREPEPADDSPVGGMMRQLVDGGLEPAVYAARVVDAVRTNRFFILSDDAHAGATPSAGSTRSSSGTPPADSLRPL